MKGCIDHIAWFWRDTTEHLKLLSPFGNDNANAHRVSKWKAIKDLPLPNENSGNLSLRSILSIFHLNLVSHHKIQFKKSKPVKVNKVGQNMQLFIQDDNLCEKGNN